MEGHRGSGGRAVAGVTGTRIRVTALDAKRRRAGFAFTKEPTILSGEQVDDVVIASLIGDERLLVEFGHPEEDDVFASLPRDRIDEMLTAYREMGDEARAEAVASDIAKAARDRAAPIGGGATGSGFAREADQAPAEPGKDAGTLQEPEGKAEPTVADGVAAAVAADPTPEAKPDAKPKPAAKRKVAAKAKKSAATPEPVASGKTADASAEQAKS